jgi:hypothetical protein
VVHGFANASHDDSIGVRAVRIRLGSGGNDWPAGSAAEGPPDAGGTADSSGSGAASRGGTASPEEPPDSVPAEKAQESAEDSADEDGALQDGVAAESSAAGPKSAGDSSAAEGSLVKAPARYVPAWCRTSATAPSGVLMVATVARPTTGAAGVSTSSAESAESTGSLAPDEASLDETDDASSAGPKPGTGVGPNGGATKSDEDSSKPETLVGGGVESVGGGPYRLATGS